MLVIKKQQLEALSLVALQSYETEMVLHCQDLFPLLTKVIGETQLRIAISQIIKRANSYGFEQRGPVRLYIEMMFLFGSSFDNDAQYPEIREILLDNHPIVQMEGAESLFNMVLDYQHKVIGRDNIYLLEALERILIQVDNFQIVSQEDFIPYLLKEVANIYPEKYSYVGDDALKLIFKEGIDKASSYGMMTGNSWALICVLMFLFGHGCIEDPLYPWIGKTLTDKKIVNSEKRYDRLKNKSLLWLDHVITNFKKG